MTLSERPSILIKSFFIKYFHAWWCSFALHLTPCLWQHEGRIVEKRPLPSFLKAKWSYWRLATFFSLFTERSSIWLDIFFCQGTAWNKTWEYNLRFDAVFFLQSINTFLRKNLSKKIQSKSFVSVWHSIMDCFLIWWRLHTIFNDIGVWKPNCILVALQQNM